MELLAPGYRVLYADANQLCVPARSAQQTVISREEQVDASLFGKGQMQRVELAKAELLKRLCELRPCPGG